MPDIKDDPQLLAISVNEIGKLDKKPKLKVRNLKPREYDGRLELSTFCVDEFDDGATWQLLELHAGVVVGRAQLRSQVFRAERLTVHPDWDPERHVNIVDWPAAEEEVTSIAQVLYAQHEYVPRT